MTINFLKMPLPYDVQRRSSIVFAAVLKYAITVLLYDGIEDMPTDIFQTLVYHSLSIFFN